MTPQRSAALVFGAALLALWLAAAAGPYEPPRAPRVEQTASDVGEPLFVDGEPSPATQAILQFCEQFEQAGHRTQAFLADLAESGLLMDGEVAIQPEGAEQPFIYRGFQMVDEEKFRNLRGDELRKLNQNGSLPLIMAHLFSLSMIREVFGRQVQQGSGPVNIPQPATVEA